MGCEITCVSGSRTFAVLLHFVLLYITSDKSNVLLMNLPDCISHNVFLNHAK